MHVTLDGVSLDWFSGYATSTCQGKLKRWRLILCCCYCKMARGWTITYHLNNAYLHANCFCFWFSLYLVFLVFGQNFLINVNRIGKLSHDTEKNDEFSSQDFFISPSVSPLVGSCSCTPFKSMLTQDPEYDHCYPSALGLPTIFVLSDKSKKMGNIPHPPKPHDSRATTAV